MGLDSYALDDTLVEEGTWVDLGPGGKWKILPNGVENKKLAKASERVFRPLRKMIAAKMVSEDKMREALAEVYAEAIVMDWQDVAEKGQPLKFSKAECRRVLNAYPRLFEEVRTLAEDIATFQRAEDEADLGN